MLRVIREKLACIVFPALAVLAFSYGPVLAAEIDLSDAVVVVRPGSLPNAEKTAAIVLTEELGKRTGLRLATSASWPQGKTVIAITSQAQVPAWGHVVPVRSGNQLPETRAEGYRLYAESGENGASTVWVIGADPRGALYGVGQLLRRIDWKQGAVTIASTLDVATAPVYSIRGHQLGYRAQANSYDAWSVAQFEQYIRELSFF
jgi:hypothetical protein